jgi:hypothetical protein
MEALGVETAAAPPKAARETVDDEYPEPPLARLAWVTGGGEPPDSTNATAETGPSSPESQIWPEEEHRVADGAGLDDDLLRRIRDA